MISIASNIFKGPLRLANTAGIFRFHGNGLRANGAKSSRLPKKGARIWMRCIVRIHNQEGKEIVLNKQ